VQCSAVQCSAVQCSAVQWLGLAGALYACRVIEYLVGSAGGLLLGAVLYSVQCSVLY
jgi:hypothetical protein